MTVEYSQDDPNKPECATANPQAGNILFLILIAVALFAALAYAVTSSGRMSSGSGVDQEARDLRAMEIIAGLNAYNTAIQRLVMFNRPDQISFENEVWRQQNNTLLMPPGSFPNCTNPQCQIFHPQGGGVVALTLERELLALDAPALAATDPAPGHPTIGLARIEGVGTLLPELVGHYAHIALPVCQAIHRLLNINDGAGQGGLPVENVAAPPLFDGTFGDSTSIFAASNRILYGRHSFVYQRDAADPYCHVVHVLMAR